MDRMDRMTERMRSVNLALTASDWYARFFGLLKITGHVMPNSKALTATRRLPSSSGTSSVQW